MWFYWPDPELKGWLSVGTVENWVGTPLKVQRIGRMKAAQRGNSACRARVTKSTVSALPTGLSPCSQFLKTTQVGPTSGHWSISCRFRISSAVWREKGGRPQRVNSICWQRVWPTVLGQLKAKSVSETHAVSYRVHPCASHFASWNVSSSVKREHHHPPPGVLLGADSSVKSLWPRAWKHAWHAAL